MSHIPTFHGRNPRSPRGLNCDPTQKAVSNFSEIGKDRCAGHLASLSRIMALLFAGLSALSFAPTMRPMPHMVASRSVAPVMKDPAM